MSGPIDLVLGKLEPFRLREFAADRWRACCPGHGGTNPSALSVGVGDNGAVLLRCWHGCSVEQVAAGLGLDLADLFPARPQAPGHGTAPIKRRRLLTAGQALELLEFETSLTVLCATDMARGDALDEATRERLKKAAARITMMREEVTA